jgi:hypothetical protein
MELVKFHPDRVQFIALMYGVFDLICTENFYNGLKFGSSIMPTSF